jgi:ribosomal protein S18 acetylase RimI-like enzyme
MTIQKMASFADPILADWLALYETSFPEEERMSRSYLETTLSADPNNVSMLAMRADDGSLLGISYTEYPPAKQIAYLYYIATDPKVRGNGLGRTLYEAVMGEARARGCRFLFFEVEIPQSGDDGLPARRIDWYRRNGASLLDGIDFNQTVDTSDIVTKMHLMVHTIQATTPESAFALLKEYFEDDLQQTGPLVLVGNGDGSV